MKEVKKETKTKKTTTKKETKKQVPKKNKKVQKPQPVEKLKLTSPAKYITIAISILPAIILIGVILSFISPTFSEFFWYNIKNPFIGFFFNLFSFAPRLGAKNGFLVVFVLITATVINIVAEACKDIEYKIRNKMYNITTPIYLGALYIIIIPLLLDFQSLSTYKISEKYYSEYQNITYTKEDIVKLNDYLVNELIIMSEQFERKDGKIVYNEDLTQRAVKDLLNVSNEYKFLKGQYPNKVGEFSKFESETNIDGTLGYTQGYGIIVDFTEDKVGVLNTITHELCHTKGLLREAETEYCAFVAGIKSQDKLSRYSALYNAYLRTSSALSFINQEDANNQEEEYLNLCLEKEYNEVCNIYLKNIKGYIYQTDKLEITTYRLRNYKNHQKELISIIEKLSNQKGIKFKIGSKKINKKEVIEKVTNEINNNSTNYLLIEFDVNEESYNKIVDFLKEYQKYYISLYLEDSDYDYYEYKEGKEAEEFYTSKFDKNDLLLTLKGEYYDEYDYERVTRLYLEYFHKIIK